MAGLLVFAALAGAVLGTSTVLPVAAVGMVAAGGAAIAWRTWPRLVICGLILMLPLIQDELARGSIGGAGFNLLGLTGVLIFAAGLPYLVSGPLPRSALWLPLAALACWLAVSVVTSINGTQSLKATIRFLAPFVLALAIRRAFTTADEVARLRRIIIAAVAIPVFVGIVQLLLIGTSWITETLFFAQSGRTNLADFFVRIDSTFDHPTAFGTFLVMMMPLVAAQWLSRGPGAVWLVTLLSLMALNLFMTLSRIAWLAWMTSSSVFVTLLGKRRLLFFSTVALLVLVVAVLPVTRALIWARFQETASPLGRLALMQVGIGLFLQQPLLGHGIGVFELANASLVFSTQNLAAHNDYIRLLAETGLPGLLVWLWLQGTMVLAAWRLRRRSDDAQIRLWAACFLAAITAGLTIALTDAYINYGGYFIGVLFGWLECEAALRSGSASRA